MRTFARTLGKVDVRDFASASALASDLGAPLSAAITAANAAGSGRVVVPRGSWTIATGVNVNLGNSSSSISIEGNGSNVILGANRAGDTLTLENSTGLISIFGFNFFTRDSFPQPATDDADSCINIGAAAVFSLFRCTFWGLQTGLQSGTTTGLVQISATSASVYDCRFAGCASYGNGGAPTGVLHVQSAIFAARNVRITDFDSIGANEYNKASQSSASWICLQGVADATLECSLDENTGSQIWVDATTVPTGRVLFRGSDVANSHNVAMLRVTNSGGAGTGSVSFEDCRLAILGALSPIVPLADLTSIATLSFRRCAIATGVTQGGGNHDVISRGGVGYVEFVDCKGNYRLNNAFGAPATAVETIGGETTFYPSSIPNVKAWYRPDLGPTLSPATLTIAGPYTAVTNGHHLDLQLYDVTTPVVVTFNGAENSQGAYLAKLTGAGLTAVSSGTNIIVTVPVLQELFSSGQVIGTTSADVLTALGISVGPFALATVVALVDQSGLADATHNATGQSGGFVLADADVNSKPSLSFTGSQALVTPVWSSQVSQALTVLAVAKQIVAATAYLFDSGEWSPSAVSGLMADYDAAFGITLVSGAVSTWNDNSGVGDAGRNLSQSTPSLRPGYTAVDSRYNGNPTVAFTVTNSLMQSGTWSVSKAQPITIFVVGNGANGNYYYDDILPHRQALHAAASLAAFAGTDLVTGGSYSGVQPQVICSEYNGASSKVFWNSTTAIVTGNAGTDGGSGITVGNYAGGGGFYLNGEIARLLVYSGILTTTQRSNILTYLATKYGATLAGPLPPTPIAGTQINLSGRSSETEAHLFAGSDVGVSATTSIAQAYQCNVNGGSSSLAVSTDAPQAQQAAGAGVLKELTIGNQALGGSAGGWKLADLVVVAGTLPLIWRQRYNAYARRTFGVPIVDGWIPGASALTPFRANHAGSPYTLLGSQRLVYVDVSGGVVTLNAPAGMQDGALFTVNNTAGDASANNITVIAAAGETIQDPNNPSGTPGASVTLAIKGASVTWIRAATENQWRLT